MALPQLANRPRSPRVHTDKHRTAADVRSTHVDFMRERTASQLTAVRNGDVYPAGSMYQGSINDLSKTERAARQLFPDESGADERLYDRERFAEIRRGEG